MYVSGVQNSSGTCVFERRYTQSDTNQNHEYVKLQIGIVENVINVAEALWILRILPEYEKNI